jgi:hypothetical protein
MFNEISLLHFICKRHVIIWKVILNLGLEVPGNEVVWSSVRAVLQLRRVDSCVFDGLYFLLLIYINTTGMMNLKILTTC